MGLLHSTCTAPHHGALLLLDDFQAGALLGLVLGVTAQVDPFGKANFETRISLYRSKSVRGRPPR
jgi:hypothetical protein